MTSKSVQLHCKLTGGSLLFGALDSIVFKVTSDGGSNMYLKDVASLIAPLVKNLPEMQETPVRFLGREDPLEKG